jgi:hypothetical protein
MTSRKAKTFEEKINAILQYEEYTGRRWQKARFLPKFAYLADDELEALLRLGQEIERYAISIAETLFSNGEALTEEDRGRFDTLKAAIREKYPYLDAVRVQRLTAQTAYYVIT